MSAAAPHPPLPSAAAEDDLRDLPAWNLPADAEAHLGRRPALPRPDHPELAWGGSDGAGVTVCVLDDRRGGSTNWLRPLTEQRDAAATLPSGSSSPGPTL